MSEEKGYTYLIFKFSGSKQHVFISGSLNRKPPELGGHEPQFASQSGLYINFDGQTHQSFKFELGGAVICSIVRTMAKPSQGRAGTRSLSEDGLMAGAGADFTANCISEFKDLSLMFYASKRKHGKYSYTQVWQFHEAEKCYVQQPAHPPGRAIKP